MSLLCSEEAYLHCSRCSHFSHAQTKKKVECPVTDCSCTRLSSCSCENVLSHETPLEKEFKAYLGRLKNRWEELDAGWKRARL